MAYIIILSVLIIVFYYYYHAKRTVVDGIDKGYNLINGATAIYLSRIYVKRYEREFALKLTAAVTNELFGNKPSNQNGEEFRLKNQPLITKEIHNLKHDEKLCHNVSVAIQLKFNTIKKTTGEHIEWIYSLKEAGILRQIDKTEMPKTNDEFLELAGNFMIWVDSLNSDNALKNEKSI